MTNGTLRTVKGDATDPQREKSNEIVIIPHVCNNQGGWGAGFVLALSKKWEEPEREYRGYCDFNKSFPILGKVCYAKIHDHLVIANMIGQEGTVSAENSIPIKYKALVSCMSEVFNYIEIIKHQTSSPVVIHCPKFGSDLAGGNFDFILELIREIWIEQGIDVVIYTYVQ
jgi:hypothetical protein